MAISYIGLSSVVSNGATTTTTATATPAEHANTLVGDRVFLLAAATGSIVAPTGWTVVQSSIALGAGTLGASTGPRHHAIFYRDYDGTASPAVSTVSHASPTLAVAAMSLRIDVGQTWDTPTVTTGGDVSAADVNVSVTGGSVAIPTDAFMVVLSGTSRNTTVTAASESLTAPGVTFGVLAKRGDGGSATGNDVSLRNFVAPVATGATAAPTIAYTVGATTDAGAVFMVLTASGSAFVAVKRIPDNPARFRASLW